LLELSANLVAIAVNLVVGLRLLRLARSNGHLPEKLLGAALVFDGLEWLMWFIAIYTPAAGTPFEDGFGYFCRAGMSASAIFLLAFNQIVFRPGRSLSFGFSVSATLAMILALVASGVVADWHGYRVDLPWTWLEMGAQMSAYVWTLGESLRCYRAARRRMQIGLSDPVTANRFLLWAGYGAGMTATTCALIVAQYTAGITGEYPGALDVVMSGSTLLACVAVWMAFFAPRAYRRWLGAAAA